MNKYAVARPGDDLVHRIEYVLDEDGDVKFFAYQAEAVDWLLKKGLSHAEIDAMRFISTSEMPGAKRRFQMEVTMTRATVAEVDAHDTEEATEVVYELLENGELMGDYDELIEHPDFVGFNVEVIDILPMDEEEQEEEE